MFCVSGGTHDISTACNFCYRGMAHHDGVYNDDYDHAVQLQELWVDKGVSNGYKTLSIAQVKQIEDKIRRQRESIEHTSFLQNAESM